MMYSEFPARETLTVIYIYYLLVDELSLFFMSLWITLNIKQHVQQK